MVSYRAKNARTELEFSDECEASKQYAIRSEVASVSCAYDPVLFCDILDNNIALSKVSTAVGSTTASPKYPDSVMDLWDSPQHPDCESLGSVRPSAMHGVPSMAADVRNAYLQSPTSTIYTRDRKSVVYR